jgi:hypothetical protein
MPFDADYPKDDYGQRPAEPAAGPLWLRCAIAAMIFALAVALLLGSLWPIANYLELL